MASVEMYISGMEGVPPPPSFPPPNLPPAPGAAHPPPSASTQPQDPGADARREERKRHEEEKRKREKERAEKEKRRMKEAAAKKAAQAQLQKQQAAAAAAAASPAQLLDNRLRRDTPFQATIRFKNDLPEIPGDPKMIVPQLHTDRLAAFKLTTLEREPKRELLLGADLGIPVSLLDVERYAVPASGPAPMEAADKALLAGEDEKMGHMNPMNSGPRHKPRAIASGEVSWLMRTTYISHDSDSVRKPGYSEKQAKSIRKAAQASLGLGSDDDYDNFGGDRNAQIAAIEAEFEAAKKPPVHAKNPALTAMEILPVFPDFDCWSNKYVQAHFDNDPTEEVEQLAKLPAEWRRQVAARCMLKGFKLDTAKRDDTQGGSQAAPQEKFMALVVPSNNTPSEEETGPSALEGDYMWSREYAYDLLRRDGGGEGAAAGNPGLDKQEFFIRFADGVASYCDIFARLELRKRGEMSEKRGEAVQFARPSKVIIRQRDVTEAELEEKARKMRRLYGEMDE